MELPRSLGYMTEFKPGHGHWFSSTTFRCFNCEARWGSEAAANPCLAQPDDGGPS